MTLDHLLSAFLGVNFRAYRVSSSRRTMLSIHPQHTLPRQHRCNRGWIFPCGACRTRARSQVWSRSASKATCATAHDSGYVGTRWVWLASVYESRSSGRRPGPPLDENYNFFFNYCCSPQQPGLTHARVGLTPSNRSSDSTHLKAGGRSWLRQIHPSTMS